MRTETYLSSDDSALLRKVLRRYSGGLGLEIGAGNGGGLIELSNGFTYALGTDLHRPSDKSWRRPSVDYVLADAASCFRDGTFDLIAFNPPYLPSEDQRDDAVDGGPEGVSVTLKFLREAVRALKSNGKVVMLLSSDNPVGPIAEICGKSGLSMKSVASKHLFFESLSVYELSR